MMIFVGNKKPQKRKKNLWSQGQNEQQNQPTYDAVCKLGLLLVEVSSLATTSFLMMGVPFCFRTLVSIQSSVSLFLVELTRTRPFSTITR